MSHWRIRAMGLPLIVLAPVVWAARPDEARRFLAESLRLILEGEASLWWVGFAERIGNRG